MGILDRIKQAIGIGPRDHRPDRPAAPDHSGGSPPDAAQPDLPAPAPPVDRTPMPNVVDTDADTGTDTEPPLR